MLEVTDLSYGYGRLPDVVKDVTFAAGPGMHLLLGPNGAGKSTLLALLAGLARRRRGTISLDGVEVGPGSPEVSADIFYLAQDTLFPLDTIRAMARLHAPFYPYFSQRLLDMGLAAFDLTGHERLRDLSDGNRHKAQVAYALALDTRVLLLDEPANALDITSKKELARLLARAMELDPERTIIVATHTVQEMRHLFDAVTILNGGRVALSASTGELAGRLAFLRDSRRCDDAIIFEPGFDGATQIVPNPGGEADTPIDYMLLYTAATSPGISETLNAMLAQ